MVKFHACTPELTKETNVCFGSLADHVTNFGLTAAIRVKAALESAIDSVLVETVDMKLTRS